MAEPRVLMVSYWYPPAPGAGAHRAAGFARHLPSYGCEPLVLTTHSRRRLLARRRELPTVDEDGIRILRVADVCAPTDALGEYAGPPQPRPVAVVWKRLLFPDRFLLWGRRAVAVGRACIRSFRPNVVWTTFPPASAARAALTLAREHGLPLVVDFRDNWIGPGGYQPASAAALRRHRQLEAAIVGSARAVVTVSRLMWQDLSARCGAPGDLGRVIPNGFDAGRCAEIPPGIPAAASTRPTLAHIGSVLHRNRPDLFLAALRNLEADWPCRVRFVGNLSREYVAALGLSHRIDVVPTVPPERAWLETCKADALLLLVGDYVARWGHNAKVFEYLRSGRPILCVEETPDSNDAELLRRVAPRRVVFARLRDAASIGAGLRAVADLAAAHPARKLDVSAELLAYDRRALAGELAEVLRRAVGGDVKVAPDSGRSD